MSNITGEFRFRNEGDLLVLQVNEIKPDSQGYFIQDDRRKWRDAKTQDLLNIEFCRPKDGSVEPKEAW